MSQQFILLKRKRLGLGRRVKKDRQIPVEVVQACRTGFTRLVNVKQFRDSFVDVSKQLYTNDEQMLGPPPDLSVDDVAVDTPFQAIERAIANRVRAAGLVDLPEGKHTKKRHKNPPAPTGAETKGQGQAAESKGESKAAAGESKDEKKEEKKTIPIPTIKSLLEPLAPLKKERRMKLGKKKRMEVNAMSQMAFDYDVKTRTQGQDPVELDKHEVILRVSIYHPTNYHKTQEFLVLGSQALTALRDRIYCLQDKQLDGEHTKSGCFFIEGKFYNDLRDHRAIRYSDQIINWVKEHKRYAQPGLSHYEAASMQDTLFGDLSLRLGSHYLYQHQGDCRHVIIFTELRIRNSSDINNKLAYPVRPFQAKTRRKKCRVCDLYPAVYVTYGDKLANENPFFYCEECYRPLHYSYQGNLLYDDFAVFEYDHE